MTTIEKLLKKVNDWYPAEKTNLDEPLTIEGFREILESLKKEEEDEAEKIKSKLFAD